MNLCVARINFLVCETSFKLLLCLTSFVFESLLPVHRIEANEQHPELSIRPMLLPKAQSWHLDR